MMIGNGNYDDGAIQAVRQTGRVIVTCVSNCTLILTAARKLLKPRKQQKPLSLTRIYRLDIMWEFTIVIIRHGAHKNFQGKSLFVLYQFAPALYAHSVYACFPRTPQGFPLQAFLPMNFTATFVTPAQFGSYGCHFRTQLNRSLYLLTYSLS